MGATSQGGRTGLGAPAELTRRHERRLRETWSSAGWPCHDVLELDLLAVGLLSRHWDQEGRETVRVTEAGIQVLTAARRSQQAAFNAHETLVGRVARDMQRAGRLAWRGLSLRAPLAGEDGCTTWAVAMPDVFSIRQTTVEDYTEPVVHEVKVRRADLLSDLRSPSKGAAYRAIASQCWYVVLRGIAEPGEVPDGYGVMLADEAGLEVVRAAPSRAVRVPFAVWMVLAKAVPEPSDDLSGQFMLAPVAEPRY